MIRPGALGRRRIHLLPALILALAACGGGAGDDVAEGAATRDGRAAPDPHSGPSAVHLVGARGDTLSLAEPATRIVSLVPAVSAILVELGAGDRLVARTDYDTLAALASVPSVGGGIGPNLEVLRQVDPQVVIVFAGESDRITREGLEAYGIPAFYVRPDGIRDVLTITRQMGALTGRIAEARRLAQDIETDLEAVASAVAPLPTLRTAYLLGGSPPWAAGPGTFISDLIEVAGGSNALTDLSGLYAAVSPEVLQTRELDVILTEEGSSLDDRIVRGRRVARLPSWVEIPGPRLGAAAWAVARALHGEALPDSTPGRDR